MSRCCDCYYYDEINSYSGWCGYFSNSKVYADDKACDHYTETGGSGGCFMTTACCEFMGLSDDCYELTTMRKFRDEYLVNKNYGKQLIATYYSRAPKIVDRINAMECKEKIYRYIYSQIRKFVSLFEHEKYDDITIEYLTMMYRVDLISRGEERMDYGEIV